MAWKGIVGRSLAAQEFDQYCHTGEHIRNLEPYYHDSQGWSAGPHLFIDDRQIWVFTPLAVSGVHSPS